MLLTIDIPLMGVSKMLEIKQRFFTREVKHPSLLMDFHSAKLTSFMYEVSWEALFYHIYPWKVLAYFSSPCSKEKEREKHKRKKGGGMKRRKKKESRKREYLKGRLEKGMKEREEWGEREGKMKTRR